MHELEQVRAPTAVPIGLAVPDGVWEQVDAWPTRQTTRMFDDRRERAFLCCEQDGQSIATLSVGATPYHYEPGQLRGLILSHLIQQHGWSRQGPS